MKRWLICALILGAVAVWNGRPFTSRDVANLQPLSTVRIDRVKGLYQISTDTGDFGAGKTLQKAFSNLSQTCPGELFPDTAQFVIITPAAMPVSSEIYSQLRPSCELCIDFEACDLELATKYLTVHRPGLTLADYRLGIRKVPILRTEFNGRMMLNANEG